MAECSPEERRLLRAIARMLRECEERWFSSHRLAYVIPWGQATELSRAYRAYRALSRGAAGSDTQEPVPPSPIPIPRKSAQNRSAE